MFPQQWPTDSSSGPAPQALKLRCSLYLLHFATRSSCLNMRFHNALPTADSDIYMCELGILRTRSAASARCRACVTNAAEATPQRPVSKPCAKHETQPPQVLDPKTDLLG